MHWRDQSGQPTSGDVGSETASAPEGAEWGRGGKGWADPRGEAAGAAEGGVRSKRHQVVQCW